MVNRREAAYHGAFGYVNEALNAWLKDMVVVGLFSMLC